MNSHCKLLLVYLWQPAEIFVLVVVIFVLLLTVQQEVIVIGYLLSQALLNGVDLLSVELEVAVLVVLGAEDLDLKL